MIRDLHIPERERLGCLAMALAAIAVAAIGLARLVLWLLGVRPPGWLRTAEENRQDQR